MLHSRDIKCMKRVEGEEMKSIYVCVAILLSVVIIISNHMDNKIVGNIGAIGIIATSLLFALWKNKDKDKT